MATKMLGTVNRAHRNATASEDFEVLTMVRQAGGVRRFHTEPMIPPQSVAEHSWQGAMMCLRLWPAKPHVAIAFLKHDTGEMGSGDLPAPAKWANPALKIEAEVVERDAMMAMDTAVILSDEDEMLLKFADSMELMWYCADQYRIGNTFALEVFEKVCCRWYETIRHDRTGFITQYGKSAYELFNALCAYVNKE